VVVVLIAGCGGGGDGGTSERPALMVSAASSLKTALIAYGERFDGADAKFSFAGSDELAAQIEQGVKPDVFASANTNLPDALHAEKLVEKPVVFAANRLVLAVPADSTKVSSVDDLVGADVDLVVGAEAVPVGAYTRRVLSALGRETSGRILSRVRSNEPDVAGIVGKLTQGAADAGFVYATDVAGAGGRLRAIELPGELQPRVAYGVAVVRGAKHPEQARAFVRGLLSGAGSEELREAGFERPPAGG
jgi:molybdate transport system substrate-binding protein